MPRVATMDPDRTQISTDKTTPAADGVEVTTVSVTLKQDRNDADGEALPFGQGLAASNVVLAVTPSTGVTITQPTGSVDANGTVTGTFVSTNATTVSVTATAVSAAVTGGASVVVGGSVTPPTPGDPFFTDTFAGGVKTNDNGFTWGSVNGDVTVQLAPDASGDYALRFRFGPDAIGSQSIAEQRFALGQNLAELWIEHYVWWPSNFVHRNDSPTNNKLLRLWGDSYADIGKVGASTWYSASAANTSVIRIDANDGTGIDAIATPAPELNVTLGAWTRVRWHWVYPDSGTDVGHVDLFLGDTQVFDLDFDGSYIGANPYWNNGYFFGAPNSGYTDETDIYIRGGSNGPKFYDTDPGW